MSLRVSIGTIADIASSVQKPAPAYLPALTGMRFLLALWVVLHHISGPGMMLEEFVRNTPPVLNTLLRGGYLAVQTFFVLSGFVLAQTYTGDTWNGEKLKDYFVARFARIYPVYFFSLLVVLPFILDAMMKPTGTVPHKISLLTDYTLLLQGWKGNLGVGWNTPAWTLSCEFFFYLSFPLLLPIISRAGKWVLVLTLIITTVLPPALPHWGVPWDWKPLYHVSDFAAGIAASRIFDLSKRRWSGRGAWLYLPATILGVALILHPQTMDGTYGDLNAGLRPLNVVALLGLAYGGGRLADWLSSSRMDLLGKASYALYILHVPILWWYSKWAMRRQMALPRIIASVLYVTLVILASIVVFQRIEVPVNRFLRRKFGTPRHVPAEPHPYVTAP